MVGLTLAALCLPLVFRLPPSQPGYAVRSFAALYCAVALLYAPYMPKLAEWVYMCSLGSLAQLLVVVRVGHTPKELLTQARALLNELGCTPIGAVIVGGESPGG